MRRSGRLQNGKIDWRRYAGNTFIHSQSRNIIHVVYKYALGVVYPRALVGMAGYT